MSGKVNELIDSALPHYLYIWFKSIQIKDVFLPTHSEESYTSTCKK